MATEPFREDQIELSHGSGGLASRRLLEGFIVPHLTSSQFNARTLADAAILPIESGHLCFYRLRSSLQTPFEQSFTGLCAEELLPNS
ncbi:MAG: hypothetical protein HC888_12845, partial [Candidatus Competibacteraceae bacterium]|nr:hypothetical protein [Candidatus Competibacteraceae bacterium]